MTPFQRRMSRRTAVKGAATAALATGAAGGLDRAIAAPAVIRQTGSKVEVTYWGSFGGANGEVEEEVVRRFNESQSDVVVRYEYQGGYEETAQKLTAAVQANLAPDVSLLDGVWWLKFFLAGALAPMNPLMEAQGVDPADYVDSLYVEGVFDGVNYWLPFARSTPIFYYNKDVWGQAGLPDRGPETWTEFLEWAPALAAKDGDEAARTAFAHPKGGTLAWIFQCLIWQFGGRISDPDFTVRINEPAGIEAGEFYRSSITDGWAVVADDVTADFGNGLSAAMINSTGSMQGLLETAQFELGTAFLPKMREFGCCTGGAGMVILSSSSPEKQEAAFRFVSFASSPEITTYWAQSTGYMPVRKSALTSPEMQAFYQERPTFKTAVDQLALTKPQDACAVLLPNGELITAKGMERIMINDENVKPVLDDVAAELAAESEPIVEAINALDK